MASKKRLARIRNRQNEYFEEKKHEHPADFNSNPFVQHDDPWANGQWDQGDEVVNHQPRSSEDNAEMAALNATFEAAFGSSLLGEQKAFSFQQRPTDKPSREGEKMDVLGPSSPIRGSVSDDQDPWSSKPSLVESSFDSNGHDSSEPLTSSRRSPQPLVDSTKQTTSAVQTARLTDPQPVVPPQDSIVKVSLCLEENLSIIFDDLSEEPICRVVGLISVKPTSRCTKSFTLTVRDRKSHVDHWEVQGSSCTDVTKTSQGVQDKELLYRVSLQNHPSMMEMPVLLYNCVPTLKPIPILLKAKVQALNGECRLGIRIRANPHITHPVKEVVVVTVVPPNINGADASFKPRGGLWNELKRTVSWALDDLEAGGIVDLQAKFNSPSSQANTDASKFPVLVYCSVLDAFSGVDVLSNRWTDDDTRVELETTRKSRVLYRNVL